MAEPQSNTVVEQVENSVYLVIDNNDKGPTQRYRTKSIRLMSVIHLILGSVAVTINCLQLLGVLSYSYISAGIYFGLVFTATGTIGLASLRSTSACKITTFLVFSIISAVLGGFMFLFFMTWSISSLRRVGPFLLAIVGLVELILGCVSSSYACMAFCECCCSNEGDTQKAASKVVYLAPEVLEEGSGRTVVKLNLKDGGIVVPSDNPDNVDGNDKGTYSRFQ